ncbi:MAG: hypothetical protein AB8G11_04205 [Saprospiraceae bacterium]
MIEYVCYSYQQIVTTNVTYSRSYCKEQTKYTFEDFLKIRLVVDFLQNRSNKLNFKYANEIEPLTFQYETEKEYEQDKFLKSDKIDIFISNLGIQKYWQNMNNEDLYFAVECKRLSNKGKSNEYLTDTQKFTDRNYKTFRFPFNGMAGFIEKLSTSSISQVINDLDNRLLTHQHITSEIKNNKILHDFPMQDFQYCRVGKHYHSVTNQKIEVFHIFLNYSNNIVD